VTNLGYNAVNALRVEKSYGIWSREFAWSYTPGMSGLDRYVAFDKSDFIGREALLRERDEGTAQRLVTLTVLAKDADANPFEPVWDGERRVGFVTSGAYGHTVGESLALAYVDRAFAEPGTLLEVHVVGERRPATVVADSPYDPLGQVQRA
jgi:dimethylglycine dehydrogenase